jgi:hypothetical protein
MTILPSAWTGAGAEIGVKSPAAITAIKTKLAIILAFIAGSP